MGWLSATAAFLPTGWAKNVSIEIGANGMIREIEVGAALKGEVYQGVLLPGLVNAHTHLEQAWRGECVPGGRGFVPWAKALVSEWPKSVPEAPLHADAAKIKGYGTAAISDICGMLDTTEHWTKAGIQGIVQHEFLGFDSSRIEKVVSQIESFTEAPRSGVFSRPAAHAPYSTPPEILQAALRFPSPVPGSIHLAEDVAELAFLRSGEGPFAHWMDEMGVQWRWWHPPGLTPVEYLDSLGCLGTTTLTVHGCHLTPSDSQRLAATQTPLCLCPRSNLHIGGVLPEVVRLIEDGVRLCLGTDSLASSPDTDVLSELPILHHAFPRVPMESWLSMATHGGAVALGLPHLGSLQPGKQPGVVLLEGCDSIGELGHTVEFPRRWLVEPGVPS